MKKIDVKKQADIFLEYDRKPLNNDQFLSVLYELGVSDHDNYVFMCPLYPTIPYDLDDKDLELQYLKSQDQNALDLKRFEGNSYMGFAGEEYNYFAEGIDTKHPLILNESSFRINEFFTQNSLIDHVNFELDKYKQANEVMKRDRDKTDEFKKFEMGNNGEGCLLISIPKEYKSLFVKKFDGRDILEPDADRNTIPAELILGCLVRNSDGTFTMSLNASHVSLEGVENREQILRDKLKENAPYGMAREEDDKQMMDRLFKEFGMEK